MGTQGKLSPNKPSADVLKCEYWDKYLSTISLGEKYNVQPGTIWNWLKEYGIPTAPKGYHRFKDSTKDMICAMEGCQNSFIIVVSNRKTKFCENHRRINPGGLSPDKIPIVVEQYSLGKTTYQIGANFGYSAHYIRGVLINAGITMRDPNSRHFQDFNKKEIIAQYEAGKRIQAIAKNLHTSCPKINEILKNHPIFIQRHHARPYPFEEAARLYLDDHEPISWLSRRYKVPHKRIVNDFRTHNIPIRNRKLHWKHGVKSIDGHVVRSHIERRVDDWLYTHGLLHAYEPELPIGMSGTSDFLVGSTYIEVWGMEKNASYQRRQKEKMSAYKANNIDYISIYPDDVQYALDLLLAPLLIPLSSTPTTGSALRAL